MIGADIAVTPGDHNRLVIAATLVVKIHFKAAHIAADIGATKFVVKGGSTNRAFKHNIQRRDNALRLAILFFPRLLVIGNIQIRNAKAHQSHFRF